MEVKVFVDVLFMINFIIDYILLSITSFFAKKTPTVAKMILSSSVGAIFASCVFFVKMNTPFALLLSVVVAFLMVFLSFGDKKAFVLLKNTAVFCLVSAVASGVGFGLIFSGKNSSFAINNGIFYTDIDAYTLLFVFALSVFLIHTATGYVKKQKIKDTFLYDVVIQKNGRTICDTALFDSGNFLKDPVSQKSVIIAEWQSVSSLFDEEKITDVIVAHPQEFLYIGCSALGNSVGMYAFAPDGVMLDEKAFKEPVLVAITERPLDKDGSYRMLLPNSTNFEIS